jgi:hypothetical protein
MILLIQDGSPMKISASYFAADGLGVPELATMIS